MRFWVLLLLGMTALTGCSGDEGEECTLNDHTVCKLDVVYWVDSCGEQGDKAGDCECGCNAEFTACEDPCECVPDCGGKECGDNGCTGTCPPGCGPGQTCVGGICEGQCQPDCTDKECGTDGCGSGCPPGCGPGQTCVDGTCEGQCLPSCTGRCCGADGCGGDCADDCAATGQTCNDVSCLCEGACTPNCTDKDCGPDGCGGDCGYCGDNFVCESGACACPNTACDQACCAPGEICDNGSCCLADCTDKDCGTSCAGASCGVCGQGYFCDLVEFTCVFAGVEDCFNGELCPSEHPYCLMSCTSREARCCTLAANHPFRVDGTLDDSCEICCTNTEYPHPVLWPNGDSSCCAEPAPYPFLTCDTQERMCCSQVAILAHHCDGTTDESCRVCCGGDYPVGVIFPDGHTSCCTATHPWPCVINGNATCCEQSGQCG